MRGKVPHLYWNGASGAPKKLPTHPAQFLGVLSWPVVRRDVKAHGRVQDWPRRERQGTRLPYTYPSSNPTLTLTSHFGQNVGLGQGGIARWVVYQNLRLVRRTGEHQSHPNDYSSSCKLCTALGLWAYKRVATTIHSGKAYKIKRNEAKKVGGNRDWTSDLSICSRMLYHWAMPPLSIKL